MNDAFVEGQRQKKAQGFISENIEAIISSLKKEFPDRGFMATDSWDEYVYDVEVDNVQVEDIIIEEILAGSVTFSASMLVSYTATVDYDDPESWSKDSDTKEVFYRHRVEGEKLSREFRVDGRFKFDIAGDGFSFDGMSQYDVALPDIVDFEIDEHEYHH
ncbi:MAG: hypothetical protein ACP59X_04770 [Solidesulfovibrio sp. DCME]|uniref:hypothetical protein n=1 Tax=Solidesulfovibrio sp. DCME TaxID=3447380 RepID=UPI003D0B8868